jgi:L-2-hydroxyglutarate oxidase
MAIMRRAPGTKVLVLEKERTCGRHQTGHNSGEIHSGIYYEPGSLKATLCREGNRALVAFCREYGIAHEVCGKVIVATDPDELPVLDALHRRARLNGIEAHKIPGEVLRRLEPHCAGRAALHVPSTGIVDFHQVAGAFAAVVQQHGGDVRVNAEVRGIAAVCDAVHVDTSSGSFDTRAVVNCAGLHSDRIAAMMGVRTGMRIVPIRGTYYRVKPSKRHLVKTLIYPIPNPRYPFLGVHLNRQLNGDIRLGPNAVLALKREGYRPLDIEPREAVELLTCGAFWRFAAAHWREAGLEWLHAVSKRLFVRRVQRLVPEIEPADVMPAGSGVRAQAILDEGRVVDDFLIMRGPRSIHVCNAPSPAATSSIPIGRYVVDRLDEAGLLPRRTSVPVPRSVA